VPVSSNPPNTPADELIRLAPSFFPDPLLETIPWPLPANRTDSIRLTVYAPATAKPGIYQGRLTIEPGTEHEFRIEVAEAVVPSEQSLKVTLCSPLAGRPRSALAEWIGLPACVLASRQQRQWWPETRAAGNGSEGTAGELPGELAAMGHTRV
jgi:hypothetical protein